MARFPTLTVVVTDSPLHFMVNFEEAALLIEVQLWCLVENQFGDVVALAG